jgi:hypothetical protein
MYAAILPETSGVAASSFNTSDSLLLGADLKYDSLRVFNFSA